MKKLQCEQHVQILSSGEKVLSSQHDRQVMSKFFQFWAVSIHLGIVSAFCTVLWEKVVIFFTLAFPTNPTTSEITHPLVQMEVGFQTWCFTQKKIWNSALAWNPFNCHWGQNFSSKKKDKKSFFLWHSVSQIILFKNLAHPVVNTHCLVTVLDFLLWTRSFLTIFCKLFQELIWQGADHSGLIQKNT